MKKNNDDNMVITKSTEITRNPEGCVSLKGCLYLIILLSLAGISTNEWKRSKIRLERDKIKLEQLKKDTVVSVKDGTQIIEPDTLMIGSYKQVYFPLLKQYQIQKQKGN